ncbi:hypothetical protein AAC387_Pa01g4387 [Persea americana]
MLQMNYYDEDLSYRAPAKFCAYCVDDFSASALNADLLIHYGHGCLITIDCTKLLQDAQSSISFISILQLTSSYDNEHGKIRK